MEFLEYPKALYSGDVMRVVADADEEAQAREDGFAEWRPADAESSADALPADDDDHEPAQDSAPAKRKYTRKQTA